MAISSALRKEVFARARGRCEYCGLSQAGQEATFHVDHIIPATSDGPTESENLALACVSCSLRKGAREILEDPTTGETYRFFHPRLDRWEDHFRWTRVTVVGISPTGRATVAALDLNRPLILAIRLEEEFWGRHPPA